MNRGIIALRFRENESYLKTTSPRSRSGSKSGAEDGRKKETEIVQIFTLQRIEFPENSLVVFSLGEINLTVPDWIWDNRKQGCPESVTITFSSTRISGRVCFLENCGIRSNSQLAGR